MLTRKIGTKRYTLESFNYQALFSMSEEGERIFVGHSLYLNFKIDADENDEYGKRTYSYAIIATPESTNVFINSLDVGFGDLVVQRLIDENA